MQIKEMEHHLLRHLLAHGDGLSHEDLVTTVKSEQNLSDHDESALRRHLRQWHQDWVDRGQMEDIWGGLGPSRLERDSLRRSKSSKWGPGAFDRE